MGFDGDDDLQGTLDRWERSIVPRHYDIMMPYLKDREDAPVIVRTVIHVVENMIERIVVKNRRITETEIRDELMTILQ